MQLAEQEPTGNLAAVHSAFRRFFFAAVVLMATTGLSVAAADENGPVDWELANGTTIHGTVMAVRGSMVQMQTTQGRSLISISRFSEAAREKINEKFPPAASSTPPSPATPAPAIVVRPPSTPGTGIAGPSGVVTPAAPAPPAGEPLPAHPGLRTLKTGDAAPELRVKKFGTEELITLESLRGRVVLLVFWNSTEPQAVRDVQYLAVAHQAIPPEVVSIVGVSVDRQFRRYSSVATQLGATWPSHHDPARAVLRHWGVTAVPTTVVIDQSGRIFKEHIYASQLPELLQEMNLLPPR